VLSYGAVAAMAGSPRAARGAGSVLRAHGATVPWWRVVAANGRIASTRPHHAAQVQRALLEAEDIQFVNGTIDLDHFAWHPAADDARRTR
jgi:methylated-DNA-protein-cysteine methyltransferase-like protein